MALTQLQIQTVKKRSEDFFTQNQLDDCTLSLEEGSSCEEVFLTCCEAVTAQLTLLAHVGNASGQKPLWELTSFYVRRVQQQLDSVYLRFARTPGALWNELSYAVAHSSAAVSATRCVRLDWKNPAHETAFWTSALAYRFDEQNF